MSSNTCFDINAYLQVIGVSPSQLIHGADPDSLKLIYSNHVRTLPFSSLPIVCGHPVDPDLDVAGIADRMLVKRWGGVCFEHVALLGAALQRLGFDVTYLGGEVWHDCWTAPNSHASILISFRDENRFYCDVGFPLRPLEPLQLSSGKEQLQPDGRCFQLESDPGDGNCWCLQQLEQGDFELRHRFWLQPRNLVDFSGPARDLADPNNRFMRGWLLAICRAEGSLVTLATGLWAGSQTPENKAKYVSRKEVLGGVSNGNGCGVVQATQHVEHTTLLTRGSLSLRSLVEREFLIRTEQLLACRDFGTEEEEDGGGGGS
ncbi:hypothetical protein Vafri_13195 [Volvox africanus]|uniref:Arylamine N-acetyltransferase n=2 Tax=Volvox africanus TaxID=51714 RepID=A0A8J4BBJ6_9CHLO|nr:hypothetical protein Vafri_13195 [Volvox africanus]